MAPSKLPICERRGGATILLKVRGLAVHGARDRPRDAATSSSLAEAALVRLSAPSPTFARAPVVVPPFVLVPPVVV